MPDRRARHAASSPRASASTQLERYFDELLDYSEREARRTVRSIPPGVYRFVDYLDDDGVNMDQPVRIAVAIHVDGDELTVDLDGTSPQVRGAINSTLSFAKSAVYFAIRSIMDSDVPNNAGFFRPDPREGAAGLAGESAGRRPPLPRAASAAFG